MIFKAKTITEGILMPSGGITKQNIKQVQEEEEDHRRRRRRISKMVLKIITA